MQSPPHHVPSAVPDVRLTGLVVGAHLCSHFSQLLLAPLFPWLKVAFDASYAQLAVLLTVFFTVSCCVQALAGFAVDRFGPRPLLFTGLMLLAGAALGYACSISYSMLLFFSVMGGVGNGVFHPVDFTFLNRRVHPSRLGHAYSAHGISGVLGWGLAPALMVPLTLAWGWRVALMGAAVLMLMVLTWLWWQREQLTLAPASESLRAKGAEPIAELNRAHSLDFLRIPAVWMCFTFFFFYAAALSGVQAFAPEAARLLHQLPVGTVAICLPVYMACSAAGMLTGGFLVRQPQRCEKIIALGFSVATVMALTLGWASVPVAAVPVLFGVMGWGAGIAGPSRDLLVKQAAPPHATGRVYGVIYCGLDIGQALTPLMFGALMDRQQPMQVWLGIAAAQGLLIVSAFQVRKARRITTDSEMVKRASL